MNPPGSVDAAQGMVSADPAAGFPEKPPATGWARVAGAMPWPLAVIPPFVAMLALPLLGLAIVFSVVASSTHVVQSSVWLTGRVEVRGMPAIHADRSEVDFGELSDLRESRATIFVTNSNPEPAWVVVTATGIPPGCSLVDFPQDAVLVGPGQTQEVHVGAVRVPEAEGGEYQFRLILLASAEQ